MNDHAGLSLDNVFSIPVSAGCLESVADQIIHLSSHSSSAYVCVANAHMIVTAKRSPSLLSVMNNAALVCSDGMPLVWELRRKGHKQAERVAGPDLMRSVCKKAEAEGIPIYFYGGSEEVAQLFEEKLKVLYPNLNVAGVEAPPLLPEKPPFDKKLVQRINESGAKVVFVGLGCPKQEYWMAEHSPHLSATLVGVGAAFDFMAGKTERAPHWMQKYGLEWLYRLLQDPGRLWKRYLVTNTLFCFYWLQSFINRK